ALTDIWTGDADGEGERLITTGLLGSIRWWFEVLVRGLGGSACDPSFEDRKKYPRSSRCPDPQVNEPTKDGHHCVVCQLFGCTGWARKFRFQVLDENGKIKQNQIKKGETVQFVFSELRPIREEEWALLDITLCLVDEYGAIGGKTVFKPSEERNRHNAFRHKDFGLIRIEVVEPVVSVKTEEELRQYVKGSNWRDHDGFAWASLDNFWCVKGRYLARQNANTSTFNRVVGRPEPKGNASDPQKDSWLAGYRATHKEGPASKKVFSFKEPEDARRTFGFVKPGTVDFNAIKNRLKKAWSDLRDEEFLQGGEILKHLFRAAGVEP
ncbi:MAG: type III-B CRISPR module RAMP protein Cmr1, partial [Armatimonadota bacterium]